MRLKLMPLLHANNTKLISFPAHNRSSLGHSLTHELSNRWRAIKGWRYVLAPQRCRAGSNQARPVRNETGRRLHVLGASPRRAGLLALGIAPSLCRKCVFRTTCRKRSLRTVLVRRGGDGHRIGEVKDGKSRSGSRSRGWPEARTPDWPGPRRVPRISLRCTDLPPVPAARQLGLAADSDRPQAEAAKVRPQRAGSSFAPLHRRTERGAPARRH